MPHTRVSSRLRFNDPAGQVGLWTADDTRGPSIRFGDAALIPTRVVGPQARFRTRVSVAGLAPTLVVPLLAEANRRLTQMRARSADVGLTAFLGLRADGQFRRRLDYATAGALLTDALQQVEGQVSR